MQKQGLKVLFWCQLAQNVFLTSWKVESDLKPSWEAVGAGVNADRELAGGLFRFELLHGFNMCTCSWAVVLLSRSLGGAQEVL